MKNEFKVKAITHDEKKNYSEQDIKKIAE